MSISNSQANALVVVALEAKKLSYSFRELSLPTTTPLVLFKVMASSPLGMMFAETST